MMINKKWLEKNQVIVYLIIIILGMTLVKIKYGYKGEKQISDDRSQMSVTATPTISPTLTVDPKKDYPLIDKLPYYGKGYVVEKYTAPMTLKMILNRSGCGGLLSGSMRVKLVSSERGMSRRSSKMFLFIMRSRSIVF